MHNLPIRRALYCFATTMAKLIFPQVFQVKLQAGSFKCQHLKFCKKIKPRIFLFTFFWLKNFGTTFHHNWTFNIYLTFSLYLIFQILNKFLIIKKCTYKRKSALYFVSKKAILIYFHMKSNLYWVKFKLKFYINLTIKYSFVS